MIDGLVRIKPAIARAQELEMPALAITDQCNLYGQIKFYRACLGAGIKPITAADFWLSEGGEGKPTLITLYAMNADGYRNVTELISRAWMEGQYHGNAYIKREWVKEYSEGVLMLSGAKYGDVGRALVAGRRAQAEELAREWAELFPGRYYLELQRTGRAGDEDYLHSAVDLAQTLNLPVVATNDVRFMEESEFEAHEVRVCIHEGRALDDPAASAAIPPNSISVHRKRCGSYLAISPKLWKIPWRSPNAAPRQSSWVNTFCRSTPFPKA